MLLIVPNFAIPDSELELTYARSSGPGGQNVNKVNSKAVLRWNLFNSGHVPFELRTRLFDKLRTKISVDGDIVIASDRFRDQIRNREDCLEKLREMLAAASQRPKPRKKTKPSRSSTLKNKQSKRKHSDKKRMRSGKFD